MKTPDEIKMGLECCSGNDNACDGCPYANGECILFSKVATDALAYIQQLELERDALAALYKPHGTCGSCKHNGSKLCDNCTNKNNCWEWGGIKEVTR